MEEWLKHIRHFIFKEYVHVSVLALCVNIFWKDRPKTLTVAVDIGVGRKNIIFLFIKSFVLFLIASMYALYHKKHRYYKEEIIKLNQ